MTPSTNSAPPIVIEEYLRVRDIIACGFSASTVYSWLERRLLPHLKIGRGLILIHKRDFERFLAHARR